MNILRQLSAKKAILLFLYLLLFFSKSQGAESKITREILVKKKNCINSLSMALNSTNYLSRTWFSDLNSTFSIHKRFSELSKSHQDFIKTLEEYSDKPLPTLSQEDELRDEYKTIDNSHFDFNEGFSKIANRNERFLISLEELRSGITLNQRKYSLALRDCSSNHTEMIQKSQSILKKWFTTLQEMSHYVADSSKKASHLLDTVLEIRRIQIKTLFLEKTQQSLEDFEEKISDILLADKFYGDLLNGWSLQESKTQSLLYSYLQFRPAVREVTVGLQKLENQQEKISHLLNVPQEGKDQIIANIKTFRNILNRRLNKLKKGGWANMVDRQKKLTLARKEILQRFPSKCQKLIQEYLIQYNEGHSTYFDLRTLDELYIRQMKCIERGES